MTLPNPSMGVPGQNRSSPPVAAVDRTRASWEAAWAVVCLRVNEVLAEKKAGIALPHPDATPRAGFEHLCQTLSLDVKDLRQVVRRELGETIPEGWPPIAVGSLVWQEWSESALATCLTSFRQYGQMESGEWWRETVVDPMKRYAESIRATFAELRARAQRSAEGRDPSVPLTLRTLKDSLTLANLHPAQIRQLQETQEGWDYWRRLSQAHAAVANADEAGDSALMGCRHFLVERFGGYTVEAVNRARDWLVAEQSMTREQAEALPLADLLTAFRARPALTAGLAGGEARSTDTNPSPGPTPPPQPPDPAEPIPPLEQVRNKCEQTMSILTLAELASRHAGGRVSQPDIDGRVNDTRACYRQLVGREPPNPQLPGNLAPCEAARSIVGAMLDEINRLTCQSPACGGDDRAAPPANLTAPSVAAPARGQMEHEAVKGLGNQQSGPTEAEAREGSQQEESAQVATPDADWRVKLREIAELQGRTGQGAGQDQPREPPVRLTAVERAIQIYLRDPNQSVRAVAREAGCDPSLLYRDERFRRLRKAHAGTLPRGSKAKDGSLEAEADEDE
jgi:hypothetical protein